MSTASLPTLNKSRSRTDLVQLIQTAKRGDLTRVPGWPWSRYAINGQVRPEIAPTVGQLIKDGLLHDTKPAAASSLIKPTTAGLSKIGVAR